MIYIVCCDTMITDNSITKILGWIIPFLLGLSSSFIIDKIRYHYKKRKIKNFILAYLEKNMLVELPKLKNEYAKLRDYINDYSQVRYKIHVFEGFNEKVLKGITSVEYYEIFKDEFILLNEIISMIEFLSSNLPYEIMNDYFYYINNHLKEKKLIGDKKHVIECLACKDKKDKTLFVLDFRIEETEKLLKKIKEFILNSG